jgi:hypothetical protein
MKKCPPGKFCISNIHLLFLVIIVLIVFYLCYINNSNNSINIKQEIVNPASNQTNNNNNATGYSFPNFLPNFIPNLPYNNWAPDVLLNPYAPPLKDNRYFIPFNVPTNIGYVNANYRQVGILTPLNKKNNNNKILSLMGRPLYTNRNLWQYYTISNQHNNVKLPIIINGKNATNDYGVNEIYTNDVVFVEGYQHKFKVTVYENNGISYL